MRDVEFSTKEQGYIFILKIARQKNGDIKQHSVSIYNLETQLPTSRWWLSDKITTPALMRLAEMYDEYRNKLLSTSLETKAGE